jgi:hypothetical protein
LVVRAPRRLRAHLQQLERQRGIPHQRSRGSIARRDFPGLAEHGPLVIRTWGDGAPCGCRAQPRSGLADVGR